MSIAIERTIGTTGVINVTSDPATTDTIPLGPSAGGMLYCVSTSTGNAITVSWFADFAPDSPDFQLADTTNAVTTTTIQPGRCYELPAELFAAPQVKVVTQTAGQTAVLRVSLKG
jgi:hypothetical protein